MRRTAKGPSRGLVGGFVFVVGPGFRFVDAFDAAHVPVTVAPVTARVALTFGTKSVGIGNVVKRSVQLDGEVVGEILVLEGEVEHADKHDRDAELVVSQVGVGSFELLHQRVSHSGFADGKKGDAIIHEVM